MSNNTKEKILHAARRLFSQKGFDGCTMDEIAADGGVNKASLYYHFKDKATLYTTVLEINLGEFLLKVRKAVAGEKSPEKQLEAFVYTYSENFRSNREMAPLMLRELASDGSHLNAATRKTISEIIAEIDAILRLGQAEGLFKKIRTFVPYIMIIGSMNIYTSSEKMRRQFAATEDDIGFSIDSRQAAEQILAIIMDGLKN